MREQDRLGLLSAHVIIVSSWIAFLVVVVRWIS
jgi:hypothetical protein